MAAGLFLKPMKNAPVNISVQPACRQEDDVIRALADTVRDQFPFFEGLCFKAQNTDLSLFDAPTFAVDVWQESVRIGTYKFTVLADAALSPADRTAVFSPLVIQWADGGAHKKAGMDKTMIGHCIAVIRHFLKNNPFAYGRTALLTTAYLTKQRAGKKFFADNGWQIIEFDKKDRSGKVPALPEPYAGIAKRIESLSAPHRTCAEEIDHVCFGYMLIAAS